MEDWFCCTTVQSVFGIHLVQFVNTDLYDILTMSLEYSDVAFQLKLPPTLQRTCIGKEIG